MRLRPYGPTAVLVETGDSQPAQLRELLAGQDGIGEVVPGARTLLVEFDPATWTLDALTAALVAPRERTGTAAEHVEIRVRYDGADLHDVAAHAGVDTDEVVRLHSAASYTVAFCGFSPGFAYLTGLDAALHVPRLAEPRTSVPAGAVAIAGEYTAVYPNSSPGGWQLIGSSDAALWDIDRDPPALLSPGTTVRFVAS